MSNDVAAPAYDPVQLELIKNALGSVVDEMVLTVVRIAYSSIMKDTMDLSSAFCDARGRMIAQGLSVPLHLGSFPDAMEAVLAAYPEGLDDGDVVVLNDPYHGGMHLPDVFMFKPVFVDGRRLGYAVVVAHHNDVGGRVAGSSAADSTEIFQEGIRLPPVKLHRQGVLNDALLATILLNVRVPATVAGDLDAQLAACRIAERGVAELAARHGIEELERAFEALLDYSERGARATIAALPDGCWRFVDHLDDDGVNPGKPVRIELALTVDGDRLVADFTGSAPQVAGAINATYSFTKSAVYFAIRSIVSEDLPNNAGFFRPIEVIAPEGTVLNPRAPGACAARGVTGFRAIDAMFGALAQVIPDRVRAAGEGGTTSYSLASTDANGRFNLFREAVMGAWGAGARWDGVDGVANPAANISNAPVELVEHQAPVLVERYALAEDSGGPGARRGGLAVERQFRVLAEKASLQLRSDRRNHPPYGISGGQPGTASSTQLKADDKWELLPTKFIKALRMGDTVRHVTAGGGGYGDPMARNPQEVLTDVRNGKVSIDAARRDYGVWVEKNPWRIDEPETARVRNSVGAAE
ncbi:MAG: hydantoinase B/oxoprolinase family protein [Rhizobiaceae bacterium]